MFLVADDIMDSSITRRGRPCWYKMVRLNLTSDLMPPTDVYFRTASV
jgi:geranylgeranyl pyrophosphate synthase